MLVQFALYIVIAVLFPALADSMAMVALFAFAIGCTVQSIQAGLNAFASGFYPTAIRSTGVGWGQGIGRLGSVVGPLLGGVAIAAGWTPAQIFIAGVVPAVVAGLAVLAIAWRQAGEARAGVAMGSTGG
jgi:AAHS family 4-hydroxybenzoate transporter-like MFS transporter